MNKTGFVPMKVHKNFILRFLREHPEDYRNCVTEEQFTGSLESYLAALEAHPGEWFVGGELQAP